MKKHVFALSILSFTLCASLQVSALVNGGFESGFPADFGTIESWEASGNPNAIPVGFTRTPAGILPSYIPHEGLRMALFSRGSNDFSGVLSQAFTTVPGTTYKLSLKIGIVSENSGRKQALEVAVADGGGAYIFSKVETIASGGRNTSWMDFNATFVAAGSQTRITLSDYSEIIPRYQSYNTDLLIDNVSISVVKPGPDGDTVDLVNKMEKFYQWMSVFGVTGKINDNLDKDRMVNGLEYVAGTNPAKKNGSAFLPKTKITNADPDGDGKKRRYLVFTYRRSQLAAGDADIEITVEWRTSTKEPWQNVSKFTGVIEKRHVNKYSGGIDLVSVYIPRTITKSSKLLTRLMVVEKD